MSIEPKEKKTCVRMSFLKDKSPTFFLKKQLDLHISLRGTPLSELVCKDFDLFEGLPLGQNTIDIITYEIFQKFYLMRSAEFSIKNSRVIVFLYTLSHIGDIVLFHVWQISTEVSYEDRKSWEQSYDVLPGACCRENFIESLVRKGVVTENQLNQESEKYCRYKTPYIKCTPFVFSYFFNRKNKEAVKLFQESRFNIPITSTFQVGGIPESPIFCYGGLEEPDSVNCTSLYDSIVFEKTRKYTRQHNFKQFFNDVLQTCNSYQANITNLKDPSNYVEQRVLYLSVYI